VDKTSYSFSQQASPPWHGSCGRAFLTHLAVNRRVSASTKNQALNAIVFMYREVVRRDPGEFGEFDSAKRPKRLPTVLTKDEVKREPTNPNLKSPFWGSGK